MTRLTDALDRARLQGTTAVPDIPLVRSTETVDAEAQAVASPAPAATPSAAPPSVATLSASTLPAGSTSPRTETDHFALSESPADDDEAMRNTLDRFEYHFAADAEIKLVVGPAADHTIVEQYRHLCAALHHAQLKNGVNTVMVTSAVEAEGKTTTAANMALTLSHSHQRRVLLIDADLRRPALHTVFQVANRDGLGDYLRNFGPQRRKPAVHEVSPTLSLLTAGRPTQDPMGALVSEEMRQIIAEAAEHFDWVIVDTPPVALLSDANLLAAMIDLAVLVVRADATAYPLVQRAKDSIGPERILGVVLNRSRRADLVVGGYGYYYYGYSYAPKNAEKSKKGMLARLLGRG